MQKISTAIAALTLVILVSSGPGSAQGPASAGIASRLKRASAKVPEGKPTARVTIRLEPGGAVPGGQRVRVVVVPGATAERVQVSAAADEGLVIRSGQPDWEAPAVKDRPFAGDLVLGAGAPGRRRLVVTAELTFPLARGETDENRRREVAVATWLVDNRPLPLGQAQPEARVRRVGRRSVISVPAEERR
jgi:hypothetical protein